jgi:hypothetical protein
MCGESVHYVNVSGQQEAPAAFTEGDVALRFEVLGGEWKEFCHMLADIYQRYGERYSGQISPKMEGAGSYKSW